MTWLLLVLACTGDPTRHAKDTPRPTFCSTVDADCDGDDDDCDGVADDDAGGVYYYDFDDDGFGNPDQQIVGCPLKGYREDGTDCDDGDRRVYPGAPERCDNVDHDCDGEVMEEGSIDPLTWFADADGDGYGTVDSVLSACVAGPGWTTDSLDCDDTRADVSPAGVEVCDGAGVDEDCDEAADDLDPDGALGQSFVWRDMDGDGYAPEGADTAWFCVVPDGGWSATGGDCDDVDRGRNPDRSEHCDGVDEDCDGEVDEEPIDGYAAYADEDEDGYGAAVTGGTVCAPSTGTAIHPGDCDDANNLRHPGAPEPCGEGTDLNCDGLGGGEDHDGDGVVACEDCDDADPTRWGSTEVCNGVDDNCDGWVDGEGAVGALEVWPDADGDGFGADDQQRWACAIEVGDVLVGGDCDDGDAGIHPGAVEDDCAGWVDADCDGDLPVDDFDGDGETACTDCDDLDSATFTGAPDPCYDGVDQDCDGGDQVCGVGSDTLVGDSEHVLRTLAVGDIDGDGLGEVLVGAPEFDGYTVDRGAVYGYQGGVSGAETPDTADWTWDGSTTNDRLGTGLAVDLGADGLPRLAVGADGVDTSGDSSGAVYLLADPVGRALADAALIVRGESSFDLLGRTLALQGDLDGDGVPDLAVGAPGTDGDTGDEGCVALWSTAAEGDHLASEGSAWICGSTAWASFGQVLEAGVDLDGDGVGELLVAAPVVGGGTVWRFAGHPAGVLSDTDADEVWEGPDAGMRLGKALATSEDLDGDGLGELFLAAPEASSSALEQGCVWRVGAGIELADAPWAMCGATGDMLGATLAAADGALAIGSPGDDTDGTDIGRILVFVGAREGGSLPADADTVLLGASGYHLAGELLAVGDLDGDGESELVGGTKLIVWPTGGWAWSSRW